MIVDLDCCGSCGVACGEASKGEARSAETRAQEEIIKSEGVFFITEPIVERKHTSEKPPNFKLLKANNLCGIFVT